MHHGSGPQNVQHQLQRSRAFAGSEEEQQAHPNPPQSPATPFAPAVSPSAPQSPGYQVSQLMNRSPVAGQNVNIALQNVGPVVGGNPQITLAPLPLPSPTSPGFQFSAQQRRFEHGSPSYIQVTSPLSQQVQTQSPTQPSPAPGPGLQSVRAGAPGPGLGLCSSSPTGGFVDASVLVRQISLSPSSGGHFVFQEGSGLAQMAPGTQVQLQHAGAPITVSRERRLSQPHAQSGGTVHHLGPQSPVAAGGAGLQPLSSPGHITTTSLPPQISSIIQGQLIQQQQVLQGPPLTRPLLPGVGVGVGGTSAFGMTSPPPPTSPSRTAVPPGLSSLPLSSAGSTGVRKAPRKLEEIPPASQELAQMRKQCLDYHYREMEALKEAFKEYLIELFFLQHLQGNMMDFLAFKKKHYAPLQAYLRQNDLDLEEEEEEEEEEDGKDGHVETLEELVLGLAAEVCDDFLFYCGDTHGSFVVRTLLQVLGGTLLESERARHRGSQSPEAQKAPSRECKPTDFEVPETFLNCLQNLSSCFLKDIAVFITDKISSFCLQVALQILHRKLPQFCAHLCSAVIGYLSSRNSSADGSPLLLFLRDQTSSRLLEQVLLVSEPPRLQSLFEDHLQGHLQALAAHSIANFPLQRFLDAITTPELLSPVFEELSPALEAVLAQGHPGVVIALVGACRRVGTHQAQVLQLLLEVEMAAARGLGEVAVLGSLLLQHLLHFSSPCLILQSLSALTGPQLLTLAQSPAGSHVLDAVLTSPSVTRKQRRRVLKTLKGHYVTLACSRHGSRVLDAIWSGAALGARKEIAAELGERNQELIRDPFGHHVARNVALTTFLKRREAWEQEQGAVAKRRRALNSILED